MEQRMHMPQRGTLLQNPSKFIRFRFVTVNIAIPRNDIKTKYNFGAFVSFTNLSENENTLPAKIIGIKTLNSLFIFFLCF